MNTIDIQKRQLDTKHFIIHTHMYRLVIISLLIFFPFIQLGPTPHKKPPPEQDHKT